MIRTSAFNITPPTYGDGMIFVALASGAVQVFNADTLESLWVYEDPLHGQPNSPITYHDGYVYTGFWNGETGVANYFVFLLQMKIQVIRLKAKKQPGHILQKVGFTGQAVMLMIISGSWNR